MVSGNSTADNSTGGSTTATPIDFPFPTNVGTERTTILNSTTNKTIIREFLQFENGTTRIIGVTTDVQPVQMEISLQSTNPEVRLVSIAALFGLLGASISGITSVLTSRVWDSGE